MKELEDKLQATMSWIEANTPDPLGILIPISGGSDSALCFWMYNQLFPERVRGVYFGTNLRAEAWFSSVGLLEKYPTPEDLFHDPELVRWAHALRIALADNCLLIGTRNRTEHALGTFSHASRVAFHLPLVGLWKSEILALCSTIGVPLEIIQSSREADPACGRPAALVAIPYELIDRYLKIQTEGLGEDHSFLTEEQHQYLERLYRQHHYKASLPLSPA